MNAHIKGGEAVSYSSLTCRHCLTPEIVSVEDGNPLQYSCLENSLDRGAWQDIVHGVTSDMTEQLSVMLPLRACQF